MREIFGYALAATFFKVATIATRLSIPKKEKEVARKPFAPFGGKVADILVDLLTEDGPFQDPKPCDYFPYDNR
jgi:hypothetical protein